MTESRLTKIEQCNKCCSCKHLDFCQVEKLFYLECSACRSYGALGTTKKEAVKYWNIEQIENKKGEKEHVH